MDQKGRSQSPKGSGKGVDKKKSASGCNEKTRRTNAAVRNVAKSITGRQLPHLIKADMKRKEIDCGSLIEANLVQASTEGGDLRETNFKEANLSKAILRDCNLFMAKRQNADLRRADLSGAHLQETDLEGARLKRTPLQGAKPCGTNLFRARIYPKRSASALTR